MKAKEDEFKRDYGTDPKRQYGSPVSSNLAKDLMDDNTTSNFFEGEGATITSQDRESTLITQNL